MSDDRKQACAQDRIRINVNEKYEVEYWSKELGVNPERLRNS